MLSNRINSPAPRPLSEDIHMLALMRRGERYILLYADNQKAEAIEAVHRWAGEPELSFTILDAVVLANRIKGTEPNGPG